MIVGSDRVYSIENFYVRYLREAGVTVNHFVAQNYFYDYYQKSTFNKIIHRLGLSGVLQKINNLFQLEVETFKPDIIWVFKGMEIFPKSLVWAKRRGIKLVNFNGDSPFLFSGKGSGNENVTNSIGLYDLHFTYNGKVQEELKRSVQGAVVKLPFGFDISETIFQDAACEKEILKLCFLGNPDAERGKFLQQLAEAGIEIDLYGNKWISFVTHKNVTAFAPVYAAEAWQVLRKYRVQLNLMRPHNPDSHNMRTFELGGIGAIQLAPDTPDHRHYFVPGAEIFLFTELTSCIEQINYLLSLDKKESEQIRTNSRNRSLLSGYSYRDRANEALKHLRGLIA